MAVFRIEKTQNYTVMSNHHLRNATLTLKAKGLLSQMLSLPDEWDYTLIGLSKINRESVEAIRTAVLELERAGYITRRQLRDEKGKMGKTEYTIYEQPQEQGEPPPADSAVLCPSCDFPMTDNPTSGFPLSENTTQLNKEEVIKEKSKIDISNTDSFPFPSPRVREASPERNGMETIEIYQKTIKDNIDYDILIGRHKYKQDEIDEMVDLITETVCTARKTIRIAGDDHPAELVKSKLMKLNSGHIEFVLDCMKNNTTQIRNIKKYLLACLFNAPSTMDSYYTALVAHDMASRMI